MQSESNIKKLSSQDVMIGDWVLVDKNAWIEDEYDPRCGVPDYQPFQIKTGEDIDEVDSSDSPTYGVPLTEEILKNNFEVNYGCCYIYKNEEIGESLYYHFETRSIVYKPDNHSWSCNGPKIEYVHELQHFLRGIKNNKEITV